VGVHSVSDDVALLAEAVGELVRVSDEGRRLVAWGTDLGPAAKAAGLSAGQARGWLAGTVSLSPRRRRWRSRSWRVRGGNGRQRPGRLTGRRRTVR